MKLITGIVIGVLLTAVSVVWAKSSGMEHVNTLKLNGGSVFKVYDNDNKVVCYVFQDYQRGGISCLK